MCCIIIFDLNWTTRTVADEDYRDFSDTYCHWILFLVLFRVSPYDLSGLDSVVILTTNVLYEEALSVLLNWLRTLFLTEGATRRCPRSWIYWRMEQKVRNGAVQPTSLAVYAVLNKANTASLSGDFLTSHVQHCIYAELLNTWKFKCSCLDWNLFWVKWFTVLHFSLQLSHQSLSFSPNGHGFCRVSCATARHTHRHITQNLLPLLALGSYITNYAWFVFTATNHT